MSLLYPKGSKLGCQSRNGEAGTLDQKPDWVTEIIVKTTEKEVLVLVAKICLYYLNLLTTKSHAWGSMSAQKESQQGR